ncbi:MAG TPA: hypothetical protein VFE24_17165 [Pirellulales bacterium]|jgi:hypothetical protein|nr:hypothetical protein [Pirellulales bacterium]
MNLSFLKTQGVLRSLALLAAAVGVLGCNATRASADAVGYTVTLAEDPYVIADPTNMGTQMMATWAPQTVLLIERSRPYIEVTNTSDSANLDSFTITIGKPSLYSFDYANMISTSPGITYTLVTPTSTPGQISSNEVTLNFTGFAPGDYVRFQTGIVPDAGNPNPYPDYRQIFFDLNGNGNTSDNSMNTAVFSDGMTVGGHLEDFTSSLSTIFGPVVYAQHGQDHVIPFSQSFGAAAPEPSAMVLGGLGGLGLILLGWRKTKTRVPAAA